MYSYAYMCLTVCVSYYMCSFLYIVELINLVHHPCVVTLGSPSIAPPPPSRLFFILVVLLDRAHLEIHFFNYFIFVKCKLVS